ncbi:MAG: SDR family oxidoreductase [Myxococcales bacterium]|nr:SDR family oxidoreductase [Myxococcales bacterium]MCB9752558.1 SDR family oxidoreductase [Myxococcales bacterium]
MTAGRLQDKVVIITGASRGIGRCMALTFAREGARIVVAAKTVNARPELPGTIHTVAEEIRRAGGDALPVRVDVRSEDDVRAMVDKTLQRFGRIDALINNAGALWWQDVLDTPLKRFDLMHGVNARAAFLCAQAALPAMIEGGGGHILVCSPPVQLEGLGGKTGYMMSKLGMTLLAHGLAEEVRAQRVSVNALWPVTLVESLATINFKIGGPEVWRKPEILADAALEILTTPPPALTGRALLDEDFLRERGWTDFARYRCDPDHEPPRVMPSAIPKVGLVPGA